RASSRGCWPSRRATAGAAGSARGGVIPTVSRTGGVRGPPRGGVSRHPARGDRRSAAVWISAPLAAVAAGLAAWLLTGAALGPVERMRRRLAEITEHDAGTRLA